MKPETRARQTHQITHGPYGCGIVSVKRRRSTKSYIPGQNPWDCTEPGKLRFTSTYPVVKQNLFQVCNIPINAGSQRVTKTKKKGYTTLKVQVVGALFRQGNDQIAPRRGNGLSHIPLQPCHSVKNVPHLGIIPFQVTCGPVLTLSH
jgi:hypothetical protein